MKINPNTLMAFWPYDGPRKHFCCGTITKMDEEGNVETKEFGVGYYFKPVKILPVKAGKALKARLEAIEAEQDAEAAAMRKKHLEVVREAVKGTLPFPKK